MEAFSDPAPVATPRQPSFYPSEASVQLNNGTTIGGCLRNSYWRLKGEKPTNFAGFAGSARMDLGKVYETRLIDLWKGKGLWAGNNIKFYDKENNISGELDCLLRDNEGNITIVEIKTIYGYMAKQQVIGDQYKQGYPKLNNLMQLAYYRWFFRNKIPSGKLFYLTRDSCEMGVFNIELAKIDNLHYPIVIPEGALFTQDQLIQKADLRLPIEGILSRYKMLEEHLVNNALPGQDYSLFYTDKEIESNYKVGLIGKTKYDTWSKARKKTLDKRPGDHNCSYCQFKDKCWGGKINETGLTTLETIKEPSALKEPKTKLVFGAALQNSEEQLTE